MTVRVTAQFVAAAVVVVVMTGAVVAVVETDATMAILDYAWSLVPGDRSGAVCTCVIPNRRRRC